MKTHERRTELPALVSELTVYLCNDATNWLFTLVKESTLFLLVYRHVYPSLFLFCFVLFVFSLILSSVLYAFPFSQECKYVNISYWKCIAIYIV